MTEKPHFISDAGGPISMTDERGLKHTIPQYAVWGDIGRNKNEVIEVHEDLEYLKNKYGQDLEVLPMRGRQGTQTPSWAVRLGVGPLHEPGEVGVSREPRTYEEFKRMYEDGEISEPDAQMKYPSWWYNVGVEQAESNPEWVEFNKGLQEKVQEHFPGEENNLPEPFRNLLWLGGKDGFAGWHANRMNAAVEDLHHVVATIEPIDEPVFKQALPILQRTLAIFERASERQTPRQVQELDQLSSQFYSIMDAFEEACRKYKEELFS